MKEWGREKRMVGAERFELSASWSQTRRANRAALRPDVIPLRGRNDNRWELRIENGELTLRGRSQDIGNEDG